MCGIIGLVNDNVSQALCAGLFSLQHRGQDSCGIVTCDMNGKVFRSHKQKGLVGDNFDNSVLRNLQGEMGVGHLRYPTCGTGNDLNTQPFFKESSNRVCIVHNGNLANFAKLRTSCSGDVTNDSSLLLYMLHDELEKESDIFKAVKNVMLKAGPSYSVIALVPGHGLVVFRDQFGNRPLVYSRYGAASETVALEAMGEKVLGDVGAGECIVITKEKLEKKQLMNVTPKHCMFEWVYFSRPDSVIEKKSVYEVRINLGRELGKLWKAKMGNKEVDAVIPVPDTSRPAALGFSEETGIKNREGLIKNRYIARTFIMPTQAARNNAMSLKMHPISHELKGKKIILVDDSIVRGTTSRKLVELVRKAGATEVHFLISCPPIISPCFYGIDMTQKKELIAGHMPYDKIEELIAKEIGADSVIFQTVDGLKRAIELDDQLCMSCLTGDYISDVSDLLKNQGDAGSRPYD